MTIVQRSRFTSWLKNLTGYRGPYAVDLDHGVTPVYDLASLRPELDEEVAYWYSGTTTVAAVAANFSQDQVILASGVTGRAVIDGIALRTQGVATTVLVGITGLIVTPTNSAMLLANAFLGNRGSTFVAANGQLGAVINSRANNSASSLFTGGPAGIVIDLVANGVPVVYSPLQGTLPGFVVSPGWAFTVEGGAVNQRIDVAIWGRYAADQL